MMNSPELLAPAGDWDAFIAAVENGANAVYLGGTRFSARASATNFNDELMRRAIEYAHLRDVHVYVTVNTLTGEDELPAALEYLHFLYETGVDAAILQDLGLARLARLALPGLPLHASTQASIHNIPGARSARKMGFNRVVLARELALEEIRGIVAQAGVETEVFVHGALCICYSGQCLMSSLIGGRSGNRGRCAQPCRLPYTLVDAGNKPLSQETGQYLLSPRDLCLAPELSDLVQAGVTSLKIEGRMKRPEYVATVVRVYRRLLDRLVQGEPPQGLAEDEARDLAQIFNRDFTTGYFRTNPGADLMSYRRPNNRGNYVGRLVKPTGTHSGSLRIRLEETIRVGDGLEVWVTKGGRTGFTVSALEVDGKAVDEATPGQVVLVSAREPLRGFDGDRVFRTFDVALMNRAQASYRSEVDRSILVWAKATVKAGEPMVITYSDDHGHQGTAQTEFLAEPARTQALDQPRVLQQLQRLGETPFKLADAELDLAPGLMVPVSEMNNARRQAIEALLRQRLSHYRRKAVSIEKVRDTAGKWLHRTSTRQEPKTVKLLVRLDINQLQPDMDQYAHGVIISLAGAKGLPHDPAKYQHIISQLLNRHCELWIAPPRIIHDGQLPMVLNECENWRSVGAGVVLCGNIGHVPIFSDLGMDLYGDWSLNLFNTMSVATYADAGLQGFILSPELTLRQMREIAEKTEHVVGATVHGHQEMMVTAHCPLGGLLGGRTTQKGCSSPCHTGGRYGLQDRMGAIFPIRSDRYCKTHIYNSVQLNMLEHVPELIRAGLGVLELDLRLYNPAEVLPTMQAYWAALHGEDGSMPESDLPFTRGHFFRGVE